MNLFIHDLPAEQFNSLFPKVSKDTHVISDTGTIRNCSGCFGCWVKTPGKCVVKDGYGNMGELLSKAEHVCIVSRCCYGCYSPFVKNVLDRSIPYLLPFFKTKHKETHHKRRYPNHFRLSVYFYGEAVTAPEKEAAKNLVRANCVNFGVKRCRVLFFRSLEELRKEAPAL